MLRIGQSTDIHQLQHGDHLVLGGVTIPADVNAIAHSDGDALVHAIAESILGALALGDLGHHFPDTDPQYKGVCSLELLSKVVEIMESHGYTIGNIDSLIIIEKPKMAPYIESMRQTIATTCHCQLSQVSVKATRGEKLGFVGQRQGMIAQAVVLLYDNH